ncbi:MAG: CDP-alcohol phosphatidyltransferase family protein [Oscillospiraceae bacterium]|jgi:cardiolipin synthase|nr:CDP-alcohol phosphatidyltransferase family protein [Oscillospiraceae bacterium]
MKLPGKTLKNLTIPNILSILRLVLLFPLSKLILQDRFYEAGKLLVISALTDFLDGFLARILHQQTKLGMILDPISDKITILTVIICIGIKIPQIGPFVAILITKEVCMLCAGAWLMKIKYTPLKAKWYGKIATVFFYFSLWVIVTFKALWDIESQFVAIVMMSITTLLMVYALVRYSREFFEIVRRIRSVKKK